MTGTMTMATLPQLTELAKALRVAQAECLRELEDNVGTTF